MMVKNNSKDEVKRAIENALKETPKEEDANVVKRKYKEPENKEEIFISDIGEDD